MNKLKLNNQVIINPSKKVSTGDKLVLEIPEPKKTSLNSYDFKLDIIYEDDNILCFKDVKAVAPIHYLIIPKKTSTQYFIQFLLSKY